MFERVHSHVMDLLQKSDFDPLNFLFENYDRVSKSDFGPLFNSSNFRLWSRFLLVVEIGPKSEIQTIEKWSKIGIGHVIINNEEKIKWSPLSGQKSLFWSKNGTLVGHFLYWSYYLHHTVWSIPYIIW